jgi:membrane protease YdiL (CAAX protease family)
MIATSATPSYPSTAREPLEPFTTARLLALHLLPGALITLFYLACAPVVRVWGFPSLFAIFLAIVFVLVPFELGYLLHLGYKRHGRLTLAGVVRYRDAVPRRQFVALVVGLFLWSGFVALLVYPPLDAVVLETLFAWLPAWVLLGEDFSAYSRPALALTWGLGLVVNGVVAPVVEEIYFRGYLLPRMTRLGAWAPLANSALFSLYHFFTPWQNVGRILGLTPLVYAVWWKRNLWIGTVVHVLGNLFAMAALFAVFFS